MIDSLIPFLERMAVLGLSWGPALVFLFMTVESSFIPFPSEIVMIPAGFMAARGEFFPGQPAGLAVALALVCGIAGSLLGATINYVLSVKLGRPFLHRWGKYVLLSPEKLDRAEKVFRRYGEVTTFVCRLIPVVRQIISIPAGIARMNFKRFAIFTAAGAGVWVVALTALGYWLGSSTQGLSYGDIVLRGQALISEHLGWLLAACAGVVALYVAAHVLVTRASVRK